MKLTLKQAKDLESLLYFRPSGFEQIVIKDKDIGDFFDYSEKGLNKDRVQFGKIDNGFDLLNSCKRWRGIHMEMWEQGILDGSVPYVVLLEDMPKSVVDFMKKEMFKGIDAKLIEEIYVL